VLFAAHIDARHQRLDLGKSSAAGLFLIGLLRVLLWLHCCFTESDWERNSPLGDLWILI
jgi:hypothetical protein